MRIVCPQVGSSFSFSVHSKSNFMYPVYPNFFCVLNASPNIFVCAPGAYLCVFQCLLSLLSLVP